jgi:single-stranded-DNA-specific exonuclease
VAFRLAPRINAAGRLGDAAVGVSLLTTDDPEEAGDLALMLDGENSERQRIEEAIFSSALEQIDSGRMHGRRSFVLHHPGWHPGVIGIVASRLSERFHRPALLLSGEGSDLKGSARATPSLDLYAALDSCRDLLAEFGGHRHAAGVRLAAADLSAFAARFEAAVTGAATGPEGAPPLVIDAAVDLSDLTFSAMEDLSALSPFGAANPEPVFFFGGVRASSHRVVGNGHLAFTASGPGSSLSAIAFRQGRDLTLLSGPVDLAATPEIDTWRGGRRLRLRVHGIRPAEPFGDHG